MWVKAADSSEYLWVPDAILSTSHALTQVSLITDIPILQARQPKHKLIE